MLGSQREGVQLEHDFIATSVQGPQATSVIHPVIHPLSCLVPITTSAPMAFSTVTCNSSQHAQDTPSLAVNLH